MRIDPAYKKITADEFLAMDFNTDRRFELHDGVIVMMAGGSELHAWVQSNVHFALRRLLKGSGCRPYGSDMAVRVSPTDVRYPDISVHCGPRPDNDAGPVFALDAPVAIIEVLSPGTTTLDQGTKLDEYRALPSVQLIAFIDPVNELVSTHRRMPTGWLVETPMVRDLTLGIGGVTVPHSEIFARD